MKLFLNCVGILIFLKAQNVLAAEQLGWVTNGKMLHPDCFPTEWMSSDNFERYEERFKIRDIERFRRLPGEFFGREIDEFGPVPTEGRFVTHTSISLVKPLSICIPKAFNFSIQDNRIYTVEDFGSWKLEQFYKINDQLSVEQCNSLAPSIGATCIDSYKVEVGSFSGGSMGWDIRYGTYGLYNLPSVGLAIVPLRYE